MTPNTMLAQIYSLPEMIREVLPTFDRTVRDALDHGLCLSARRVFHIGCGETKLRLNHLERLMDT